MTANEQWITQLMAEEQKRAGAAGMNIFEYMAQASGGILKETIAKMARHAQAHPVICPPDCSFQRSLSTLKQSTAKSK